MGTLLSYSIIGGMAMLAMYLAYRVFLARDNQHSFNRSVLLLIYSVSFVVFPFIFFMESVKSGSPSQILIPEDIEISGIVAASQSKPLWGTLLIWIYSAGMIVVAVRTLITWVRLTAVIRAGKKIRYHGYIIVVTENEKFAPFSWLRYIVISSADYNDNCTAITTHELKHVSCHHWVDLLLAQAVCIINWFNPAAWLMRDELMLVHEYQADMAVINSGHDAQEYQMLLIKKAVGSRFPSLANSLNHSKLKKRITMMYQEKSSGGRKLKALALVPMLALALGVTGVPAVRAAVSAIGSSEISVDKGSENRAADKTTVKLFKVTNINNDGNETTVVIKGEGLGDNLTVSGGTFTTKGKTYHANSLKCNLSGSVATITATFPFSIEYKHPSMTLMINGQEVPFDLENFANSSQPAAAGTNPDSETPKLTTITINGKSSSVPRSMAIFLDGKEISHSDMENLPTDKIASITVDAEDKAIKITSRK